MDFILVISPAGGRSVLTQDAVVVEFSKLEKASLSLRVWLDSELEIGLFVLYTEQIWCVMAERRSSVNPTLILLDCCSELKQDP